MSTETRTDSVPTTSTAPALRLVNAFVYTHDAEASLRFYRDVLGLPVAVDVTNEGFRWLGLGVPAQPGLQIIIQSYEVSCPASDDGTGRSDQQALGDLLAKGALAPLIFETDDVDALFERVLASGAEVVQEPADQFYGVRDCAFRDPSGTMIRFQTPHERD